MSSVRSFYAHLPFCETKCHYCDFYSLAADRVDSAAKSTLYKALQKEIQWQQSHLAASLDTLFLGGGTPSMTPASVLEQLLEPILPRVTETTEWTMEVNPSSVSKHTIGDYRHLGVNRISMGVQSLNDERLKWLGRVHDAATATGALDMIFSSGFENVSVDLLCGVPGQTASELEKELETLSRFPITHLSCYLLTLPKTHKMYSELPGEDTQLEHLLLVDQTLRGLGFEHYEVSNFARPGRRAQHNLVYWKGSSYLGVGPSAHSFIAEENIRWKNVSSIEAYAKKIQLEEKPIEWSETLTQDQQRLERWLLAIRLNDGFPSTWLTSDLQKLRHKQLLEQGLLEHHPEQMGMLRLTPRGFALSDQILATLT